MPVRKPMQCKYPLRKMKVGDELKFKISSGVRFQKNIRKVYTNFCTRNELDWTFSTRKEKGELILTRNS